jgi:hypothetical protein
MAIHDFSGEEKAASVAAIGASETMLKLWWILIIFWLRWISLRHVT